MNPDQFPYEMRRDVAKVGVEAMVDSMARMNVRRDEALARDPNPIHGALDWTNPVIWQRKHAAEHAARVTRPGPERERMTDELHEHGLRHALRI